jgi:hypothetical protein
LPYTLWWLKWLSIAIVRSFLSPPFLVTTKKLSPKFQLPPFLVTMDFSIAKVSITITKKHLVPNFQLSHNDRQILATNNKGFKDFIQSFFLGQILFVLSKNFWRIIFL